MISTKGHNLLSYILFSKKFRKCFILLSAFYLILWLMKSFNFFEKIAILKIGELVSFWGVKTYFGILPLKLCIFRHAKNWLSQIFSYNTYFLTKCDLYCLYMVFWSFFWTVICTKDNFCFHEPIFYRQIKLISYRSQFWHLRRKLALLLSK